MHAALKSTDAGTPAKSAGEEKDSNAKEECKVEGHCIGGAKKRLLLGEWRMSVRRSKRRRIERGGWSVKQSEHRRSMSESEIGSKEE